METIQTNDPVFRAIPLNKINFAPYQRKLDYAKCKRIRDKYDPKLLGVLLVSEQTDGSYNILDGNHRLTALRMLGKKSASCQVLSGLTYEDEARLFAQFNTCRTRPDSKEILNAAVEAKDAKSLDMVRTVRRAGFACGIATDNISGMMPIHAVHALTSAYNKLGSDQLYAMLDALGSAWTGNRDCVTQSMLNGATLFFLLYGTEIKKDVFVKAMASTTPMAIINKARLSGEPNLRAPIAKELWTRYNKAIRSNKKLEYRF